jgi:uncharacterized protein YgbK (DUF1537 family)
LRKFAVIADDTTGALDSVAHFAHAGPVALLLDPQDNDDYYGIALSTTSRAHAPSRARKAAERATLVANARRLYIKVDSTLRGNPTEHVAGAIAAWRQRTPGAFLVICPALPAMGRTVHNGQVLDLSVPITLSAAARDPLPSARSADLTTVFPGKVRALDLGASLRARRDIVVDATTDDDLDRIAAAIEPYGADAVAVGSAGLAAAIARQRPRARVQPARRPAQNTLVLLTSLNPTARVQLAMLDRATEVVTTAPRRNNAELITEKDALAAAREAARRASAKLASGEFDSLIIIGGDGAHALLTELGARAFEVTGELSPGVPLGTLVGGTADGLVVATRSGGFGDHSHLKKMMIALHTAEETP